MESGYRFIELKSEGLVVLSHPRYGEQWWFSCKAKKVHECAVSRKPIKVGEVCYRPQTNGYNRMDRIKEHIINYFINGEKKMRAPEEKQEMVRKLQEQKKTLPEFNYFGDNNWEKIDAQVDVINGKDPDSFEDDEVFMSASEASQWLEGKIEDLIDEED
jgi:hypothetical protein